MKPKICPEAKTIAHIITEIDAIKWEVFRVLAALVQIEKRLEKYKEEN